jgi:hypothetical protein
MIVQLLLFVIAILLLAIFWELSKISSHLKKTLPLEHQEPQKKDKGR